MLPKSLLAALTVAAAAGLCSVAHAAPATANAETTSVTLRMGDLNLASRADARTALTRIRFAAEHVCGAPVDGRDLTHYILHKHCVGASTQRAVAQLSSPTVSALYADSGAEPVAYAANDRS